MASSADALNALNSFNSTRQSTGDIQQAAESKYGVSNLASQVSNLRNLTNNLTTSINNVDPSVTGRTSGSLVTEAQRSALVNKERQPLLTDLSSQNAALGQTQGDLNTAQSLAGNYASSLVSDQNTKYQSLMDQYNASVQAEKDAEAQRQWQTQFDAQQRQFEEQLAASRQASTDPYAGIIAGLLNRQSGSGSGTQSPAPAMQQRSNGGFNFQDTNGSAISAGTYAKLTGTPIGTILQQMGSKGDTYAQQAYNQIKNNLSWYNAHPDVLKSEFSSLFWGT